MSLPADFYEDDIKHQLVPFGRKKSFADFLIDEPYNEQKEEDIEFILVNCLRYRLRIPTKLKFGTEVNNTITYSRVESVYDTLMQLIDQFDATGIVEIYRLLLERRSAVPLFLPAHFKLHFLELLPIEARSKRQKTKYIL
jgi:hypothetical protein